MSRTPHRFTFALLAAALIGLCATPAGAQQGMKIAVHNTEQVLLESATGKRALADLQTVKEEKEKQGQALQKEINDLRNRVSEGRLSLSEDKLAALQQQLEDRTISLQRFQDDAQRDLNKKKDEVLASVDRKVMPIIAQIGKEKGYALIFRKFESGLIYAADEVDITSEIIKRIDAANAGAAPAAAPAPAPNPGSGG